MITLMSFAIDGFLVRKKKTDKHIKRKLTNMEVTRISIPKKKSPAKWLPKIPKDAIAPLKIIAR